MEKVVENRHEYVITEYERGWKYRGRIYSVRTVDGKLQAGKTCVRLFGDEYANIVNAAERWSRLANMSIFPNFGTVVVR